MPEQARDGWQALGIERRLVNDLLHCSRGIPLFPLEREFDLAPLVALRQDCPRRISWPVLFVKAYSLVCAATPQLRRTYMRWPWPHLYQHAESVAMVAVNRATPTGDRLCWARFLAPEQQSLAALQTSLDGYTTAPVEQAFRRQVRLSRFPRPLRRVAWWLSLNSSGHKRAKRLGTFGLSTVAGLGAVNRFHPSCLTTSLSYGPISAEGNALVTLVCDHRVVDGAPMARALAELEAALHGPVAAELRAMRRTAAAA